MYQVNRWATARSREAAPPRLGLLRRRDGGGVGGFRRRSPAVRDFVQKR